MVLKHLKFAFMALFLIQGTSQVFSEEKIYSFAEILALSTNQAKESQIIENNVASAQLDKKILGYKNDYKFVVNAAIGPKYAKSLFSSAQSTEKNTTPLSLEENYSIVASKTLYDFGKSNAELQKANFQIKVKELQRAEMLTALKFKVARAYQRLQATTYLQNIISIQLKNAEIKKNLTLENYKKGLKPEVDLLKAVVDLGKVNITYRKSVDEVKLAQAQLSIFMFPAEQLDKVQPVDYKIKFNAIRASSDWKKLLTKWNEFQPTPQSNTRKAQKELNQSDLLSIEAKKYPTLSGTGGLGLTNSMPVPLDGNDAPFKTTLTAQLTLNWDIPWNGMDLDNKLQVSLKEKDLAYQDEIETRNRAEKLIVAQRQATIGIEQINMFEEQNTLVKKYLQLLKNKYDSGKASALELSIAEDDLLNIQLEIGKIHNSIASALLDIAETTGVLNVETILE